MLTPASTAQGALLLSSVKGSDVLEKHEALLLAHKGGITVLGVAATPGAGEKVAENTRILKMMGSTSVPFLVSKRANGTFGTATGALSSSQLREFIAQ
ncbi:MAG: hypothetical protein Q7S87_09660 [Agitococcus sp.]|nr:hypothetical protein [Agitococcus sp.]